MKNNLAYRLYGRTKGRKKKNNNIFSKIKLKKIDNEIDYIIDIGAGYGESTIELAQTNNDKTVICCEKYVDGLNSLFNKVQTHSISNIEIYQGNVHQLLDEHFKKDSIFEIWILFPDPWPKKRHFKRRLINKSFFDKIHKYLKKGSTINIGTDSKSYISQILGTIHYIKQDFKWINQSKSDWDYNPEILPETKYYKKALKNGLKPFFAKLKKL